MTAPNLRAQTAALLDQALAAVDPASDAVDLLSVARQNLDGPLRVAIAGWMKAGKSTLLNALVGEPVAATDAGECTRVITSYQAGAEASVQALTGAGEVVALPFDAAGRRLVFDLGDRADDISLVLVSWPSPLLRTVTFIDTPGLESPTPGLAARTQRFVTGELSAFGVDAVVYLMRHLHGSDVGFLEAFAAGPRADAGPVNAVGVLARADEIGGGRPDAMAAAARVAARYQADGRLRRLVQSVVPVNGLLAANAPWLDADDHAALAALAAVPAATLGRALVAAEIFVRSPELEAVHSARRADLIRRLGPYGLRLAVELVGSGRAPDVGSLAAQLVARSGLAELRGLLDTRFAARADALKARAALVAAERAAELMPPIQAEWLRGRIEALLAGAHELAELGELNGLRVATPDLPPELIVEAERLLGGSGVTPFERLGLPVHAGADELRAAAVDAVDRWRTIGEGVFFDTASTRLARSVVRSAEGVVAAVTQAAATQPGSPR